MIDTDIELLKGIANQLRIHSITATTAAGSGHPTSCCSAADVVAALFFGHMRYDAKNPHYHNNDRFILSKGHAAPLLYAAWAETGLFPASDLLKLRTFGSDLEGHPTPRLPFVDVATGSLGQGLSVGIGMARERRSQRFAVRLIPDALGSLCAGLGNLSAQFADFAELGNAQAADLLFQSPDARDLSDVGGHAPEEQVARDIESARRDVTAVGGFLHRFRTGQFVAEPCIHARVDVFVSGEQCAAGVLVTCSVVAREFGRSDETAGGEVLIAGRFGLAIPQGFILDFARGKLADALEAEHGVAKVGYGLVTVLKVIAFEELLRVVGAYPGDGVADGIGGAAVARQSVSALLGRHGSNGYDSFGQTAMISVNLTQLKIRIRKLHPNALVPRYAHGPLEDAGMDLHAVSAATIAPGQTVLVPTGIAIELPPGYEAQIRPRSGLALKYSITLPNSPATIDPGYRGEIRVILLNLGRETFTIEPGERIAQMVIARYEAIEWEEGELSETIRGEGGFGSSGR